MNEIDVETLIERIRQLQHIPEELLVAKLSPEGAWIHEYEVKRLYRGSGNLEGYRYAKWQAHEPIFQRQPKRSKRLANSDQHPGFTKHQYIGRVSSTTGLEMEDAVKEAYQMWCDRKRLDAINEALREIEAVLLRVERSKAKDAEIEK